jgi:tetratricopeptide (TPR) repeat protein
MMQPKIGKGVQIAISLVALILPWRAATGQNAPTASLAEQLRAQYKVVKMGPQDNGAKVLEPGTVLVVQKGGVIAVPYTSTTVCPSRYQDGKIDSPDALCPEMARKNSRPFKVGEKTYASQIDVDLKKEKISFRIIACDSCNGTNPGTSFKSEVIFQFAPGFLEHASVPEVEDTIGDILAMDNGSALQAPQATSSQSEDAGSTLLTNNAVLKMTSFKLGDPVILDKIKTSQCNFDTSPDALIKLKQAGVSDAVLQAMIAAASVPPEPALLDSGENSQTTRLSGLYFMQETGAQLQLNPDGSFSLEAQNGRVSPGHFTVNGETLALTYVATGRSSFFKIQGDKFYSDTGKAWVRQGDAPTPAPQPPPALEINCSNYDSCMRSGGVSLELAKGAEAFAGYQKASQLDPSKADAWAGMGNAYFQMGQYDDAVSMWDKALELGATLSSFVCHAKAACGDTGDFLLSTKEISFVNKKGEKEFAAAPSAVTSEVGTPPVLFGNGRIAAYYLQLRFSGKNYRFYYDPKSLQCRSNFLCSEPGLTQQKVFADYVHETLVKMAAGAFGSQPNKP